MIIKKPESLLVFGIFILGIYFCLIGGYGSDEDTLPMINVFERRISDGGFITSRFTGFPVAEMGIGFLSYFFGSWASNLVTFLLFLIGIILFYKTFQEKKNNVILFLLICLSNPILFFDNLEPVDYSWALCSYAAGLFFLKKKNIELSILFLSICVGVRINYILFVFVTIFFFEFDHTYKIRKKIILFLTVFFFSGLFYLPIWYDNSFSLTWLTAARPVNEGFIGVIARFTYKTYIAIGFLSTFYILYLIKKNSKKLNQNKNFKFLFFLSLANLIIFLWIPSEFSYLQLFLVVFTYIIFAISKLKQIYIICLLNFISWFVFINPISVNYVDNTYCGPKNAIDAKVSFKFEQGFLKKYIDSRDKIKCWVDENSIKGKKIISGKALR